MPEHSVVVNCPHCGYPYPMTELQREVYRGRTMGCMNCGRPFSVDRAAPPIADAPADAAEPGESQAPSAAAAGDDDNVMPDAPITAPTGGADVGQPASPADAVTGDNRPAAQAARADVRPLGNPMATVGFSAALVFFVLLAVAAVTAFVTGSAGAGPNLGDPPSAAAKAITTTLLALSIVVALAAIVTGWLGWARTRRPVENSGVFAPVGGRGFALAGIGLGAGGLLAAGCLLSAVLPVITRDRAAADHARCRANLQQIGVAIANYASTSSGGTFPVSLDDLVASGAITPIALTCPAAGSTDGTTSYIYLGMHFTAATASRTTVIAYEPVSDHGDGAHVLFGDGTVVFCNPQQAAQLIAEVSAAQNPPPSAAAVRR